MKPPLIKERKEDRRHHSFICSASRTPSRPPVGGRDGREVISHEVGRTKALFVKWDLHVEEVVVQWILVEEGLSLVIKMLSLTLCPLTSPATRDERHKIKGYTSGGRRAQVDLGLMNMGLWQKEKSNFQMFFQKF